MSKKLGSGLPKIRKLDKCHIIMGDLNCNLTDALLLRTSICLLFLTIGFGSCPKIPITLTHTIPVMCRTLTMQFLLQIFKCHLFTSLLTCNFQTTFQYQHLTLVLLLSLLPLHSNISLRPNFTGIGKLSDVSFSQ